MTKARDRISPLRWTGFEFLSFSTLFSLLHMYMHAIEMDTDSPSGLEDKRVTLEQPCAGWFLEGAVVPAASGFDPRALAGERRLRAGQAHRTARRRRPSTGAVQLILSTLDPRFPVQSPPTRS